MMLKNKIKTRRLELGLTLEEIAAKVGVAKSTVKKWESGQIESMRQTKIAALASILQVKPTYLIFDDETIEFNCEINNGVIGKEIHNNTITIDIPYKNISEIEKELLHICSRLSTKKKNELLNFAYSLESEKQL